MKNLKGYKRKLSLICLITITQISCASAAHSIAKLESSDFQHIGTAQWFSDGPEISANRGDGFLVTKDRYDDFYLRVEFYAGLNTNSGIFFRCDEATKISDKSCYEANIFDTRIDQTYRTGAITGYAHPKVTINSEDSNWHNYEIYAVGDKVRVLLDGKETVYMRDHKHSSGYIALQFAQGEIKFRNFEIRKLRSSALKTTKTILDGVWELESMEIVDNSGKSTPWCPGSFGVIVYTKNYMSTAVNCISDPSKAVLYSGPFEINNEVVYHHVQNYSDPSLNKVFKRNFLLSGKNHLELRGDLGTSVVVVKWVRR